MFNVSLLYTPQNVNVIHPKYTCSDNRIHIRFRNYEKPQLIHGFERKLSYLISYILYYNYLPSATSYVKTITMFNTSENKDLFKVVQTIKVVTSTNRFKGFKFLKNYRRKNVVSKNQMEYYFGKINENCFPSTKNHTLDDFLNYFNISLVDYLFNDGYDILIHEIQFEEISKFERKEKKKQERIDEKSDFVKLW